MKELRFADSQETCFETWNPSHMCCSNLLCGPFADSQESLVCRLQIVQILLVLYWKVVILLIFTNSVFKQQNFQIWNMLNCKGVYLTILRKRIFRSLNVKIIAVTSARASTCWISWIVVSECETLKYVQWTRNETNLLIFMDRVLRLVNVHIWVVPPCFVVDLLILRIRVFRIRNVQIWVVLSWIVVVFLIFTNSVFKLINVQIWTESNCKGVYLMIDRNGIFRFRNFQIIAVPSCKSVH